MLFGSIVIRSRSIFAVSGRSFVCQPSVRRSALAVAMDAPGRHREVLSLHDRALPIVRATAGGLATADALFDRAGCSRALGNAKAAKADCRPAFVLYAQGPGATSTRTRAAERAMNTIEINQTAINS